MTKARQEINDSNYFSEEKTRARARVHEGYRDPERKRLMTPTRAS